MSKATSDVVTEKDPHLLIVGPLNFPRGAASTSRITAYAQGIMQNGGRVTILCYRPIGISGFNENDIAPKGCIEGINYIYSPGITMRPESKFRQLYYEAKGLLRSISIILKLRKEEHIDAILFYGYNNTIVIILYAIMARWLGIPLIEERCEFPFLNRKGLLRYSTAWFYEKIVVPRFDGILIMTHALEAHYKPLMNKKAKSLFVPILVDISRFDKGYSNDTNERYIAYCGDPRGNKDGVPILIEAFGMVADKHHDIKLYIIGGESGTICPCLLPSIPQYF